MNKKQINTKFDLIHEDLVMMESIEDEIEVLKDRIEGIKESAADTLFSVIGEISDIELAKEEKRILMETFLCYMKDVFTKGVI